MMSATYPFDVGTDGDLKPRVAAALFCKRIEGERREEGGGGGDVYVCTVHIHV